MEPVLRAVTAGSGPRVRAVLVLDGEDAEAEKVARSLGAETVVKRPEGPSKAAVLAWAALHLEEAIAESDGVLVLDVGSIPSPGFFDSLTIPAGADAVQSFLGGKARGVGEAIRFSESFAQRYEDAGRERLGWSVRLRGTGTGFRPEAFRNLSLRLKTQVEDLEASLLLAAAGWKAVLGPPDAVVTDEKPEDVGKAAVQRARWLAGRWQLLFRQAGGFWSLLRLRPVEGLAFLCEIWGRPFVLSTGIRFLLGGVLCLAAGTGGLQPAFLWLGTVFLCSALLTVVALSAGGGLPWKSGMALARSWMRSLWRLPSAVAGWLRAR